MTSREDVLDFVAQRRLAFVGASRSGKGFGSAAYRELKAKGYELTPVHPFANTIDGDPCVRSVSGLAGRVDGVVVVVPKDQAVKVIGEAAAAGIPRIWLQQGAESPEAIRAGEEGGLTVIAGECILMFAEPAGFIHRAHRGLRRMVGRLPT